MLWVSFSTVVSNFAAVSIMLLSRRQIGPILQDITENFLVSVAILFGVTQERFESRGSSLKFSQQIQDTTDERRLM
jgi:hypothetical protein